MASPKRIEPGLYEWGDWTIQDLASDKQPDLPWAIFKDADGERVHKRFATYREARDYVEKALKRALRRP